MKKCIKCKQYRAFMIACYQRVGSDDSIKYICVKCLNEKLEYECKKQGWI
ncbi:MAG: hypothetical protein ACFFG0_04765 [Candidatus Thorarchaeota archaeon]